jgi:hypothetical protein
LGLMVDDAASDPDKPEANLFRGTQHRERRRLFMLHRTSNFQFGTAIVVVGNGREIVMGADGAKFDGKRIRTACKIKVIEKRVAFTHAGFIGGGRSFPGFGVSKIIEDVIKSTRYVSEALDKLGEALPETFRATYRRVGIKKRKELIECIKGNPIDIFLCGMDDDKLTLSIIKFRNPSDELDLKKQTKTWSEKVAEEPTALWWCRGGSAITIEWVRTKNPTAAATKILQDEIDHYRETYKPSERIVRPPIAMVRISPTCIEWVEKPEICRGTKKKS